MIFPKILLLLVCLSCYACNEQPEKKKTAPNTTKELPLKKEKPKVRLSELERREVSSATTKNFPNCNYDEVVLYILNGKGNHSGAESVFRQRTKQSKKLAPKEIQDFLDLLNNRSSYGNSVAACHEPRIGLVFYNNNNPCAYLSLCLACNNIYTAPTIDLDLIAGSENGFSLESRKKLHAIFESWGFPDDNFSPLFDDEELYADFLKKQGLSTKEIKEEVKKYLDEINNNKE